MKCKWVSALLLMSFPLAVMSALTTVIPKALTGPLTNPGIGVAIRAILLARAGAC